MVVMKVFRIFLLAAVVFAVAGLSSCKKDKETVDITGEWQLVSDTDGFVGNDEVDVYVSFSEGAFELFQKSGEAMRYKKYSGTYTFTEGLLTGKYAGNVAWASDYTVTMDGADVMTMTAVGANLSCTYNRKAIPSDVRDNSYETKSSDTDMAPIL